MGWELDDSRPIWPQLKEQMMRDIVSGKYPVGEAFPTVRELAQNAGVNRNTMQRAMAELEADGLLITNRTAGRTVTTDNELIEKMKSQLAAGAIDRFFEEMKSIGFIRQEALDILVKKEGVEL